MGLKFDYDSLVFIHNNYSNIITKKIKVNKNVSPFRSRVRLLGVAVVKGSCEWSIVPDPDIAE